MIRRSYVQNETYVAPTQTYNYNAPTQTVYTTPLNENVTYANTPTVIRKSIVNNVNNVAPIQIYSIPKGAKADYVIAPRTVKRLNNNNIVNLQTPAVVPTGQTYTTYAAPTPRISDRTHNIPKTSEYRAIGYAVPQETVVQRVSYRAPQETTYINNRVVENPVRYNNERAFESRIVDNGFNNQHVETAGLKLIRSYQDNSYSTRIV